MSDAGAGALASARQAFRHLEVLDVSENYLSKQGEQLLAGLARKIITAEQRSDEGVPEIRHPAIGE